MKYAQSILIIAHHHTVLRELVDQLNEIGFSELFYMEACTIDEVDHALISKFSLILASSKATYTKVKPFFSAQTSYLIARRMINFSNIRGLLEIPKGTKVYLVNNMLGSAEDAINNLIEVGIDLQYVPFYPGQPIEEDITIAVTPGELQFVPKHVETIIDIGERLIELSTLFEIFNYFNISPFFANNHLSIRYMQSLFKMVNELSDEMYKSKLLQLKLEWIVNSMDDAVIVYTDNEKLQTANQKAVQLLRLENKDNILNKYLQDLVNSSFYDAIQQLKVDDEQFKEIEGIYYYIRKKEIIIDNETHALLIVFRKVDEIQRIENDYRTNLKNNNFLAKYVFQDIKTSSKSLLHMMSIANKLAQSNSTILILGETGTGKEVFAQAIHNESPRKFRPFVGINFAAISESLMESELFGYEGGAFTGAKKGGHMGVFERSHEGSIFLDEIGDASAPIQNHLLRVLQERQIMRVGGDKIVTIDVRVIAATNQNLEQLIEQGRFRQDLYYRLNVLPIHLPPLRERREDIPILIESFLSEFSEMLNKPHIQFSKAAMQALIAYNWPGNIRELRNVVEYLTHICEGMVYTDDLPLFSAKEVTSTHLQVDEEIRFNNLLAYFKQKGFMNDMMLILNYLGEKGIYSAGRPAILAHLNQLGGLITDQQLRYRLKLLSDHELIISERGRKGSQITSKGSSFIDYCLAK